MNHKPFQVVIISPEGYAHAEALREVAETVHFGLLHLGYPSRIVLNHFDPTARNILIGGNLLPREWINRVPADTILYNLEQWDSSWINGVLPELMSRCEVWDYDARNLEQLQQARIIKKSRHVPIGYVPELTRIPKHPETIDILFYGSINPRRQQILLQLAQRGLVVKTLFGTYGQERDEVIARAKIIINIHFYDAKIFEIARISYLLSNRKAVVTEKAEQTQIDADLHAGLIAVPYDQLVEACVELLQDNTRREALAQEGFRLFSQRLETDILRCALQPEPPTPLPEPRPPETSQTSLSGDAPMITPNASFSPLPRMLNIGSGKNFREDCVNLDVHDGWQPDILADLNDPLPLPNALPYQTRRFGPVQLHTNTFDHIIAFDVFEHLRNLTTAMTSCRNLLRIGGTLHIVVPYDLSFGAWQDPTHIRAFNERSWLYYTDWFWYLGWTETRFVLRQLNYTLSPLGQEMQQRGESVELITRTPRAIDAMDVILEKIPLTPADQQSLAMFRPPR
ncbi:MAG: hypothetical protein HQL91_03985 [Magnetococcales bacterium]|nr:hypothetical protein [Magnetococcales bacterium]